MKKEKNLNIKEQCDCQSDNKCKNILSFKKNRYAVRTTNDEILNVQGEKELVCKSTFRTETRNKI